MPVVLLWFLFLFLFQDALIGFVIEIEHLDGHKVTITRDKPTWPGARIRKKGEGMPNYDNNNLYGTLYVTFDIEFPKQDFSVDDKDGILNFIKFNSNLNVQIYYFLYRLT